MAGGVRRHLGHVDVRVGGEGEEPGALFGSPPDHGVVDVAEELVDGDPAVAVAIGRAAEQPLDQHVGED